MQEHLETFLETFLDRKDHAAECVDGIKTSAKLRLLSEEEPGDSEQQSELDAEIILELGRALYKLQFQLLLLLESAHKMLHTLSTVARTLKLADVSAEVCIVKAALVKAAEETPPERDTPTPTPSPSVSPGPILRVIEYEAETENNEVEAALLEMVASGEWVAALKHARLNRNDIVPVDNDEVTGILNVYCKLLARDKPGVIVLTCADTDLTDLSAKLRESLYQVLSAVMGLESQLRAPRDTVRKTEC